MNATVNYNPLHLGRQEVTMHGLVLKDSADPCENAALQVVTVKKFTMASSMSSATGWREKLNQLLRKQKGIKLQLLTKACQISPWYR
jgi:hypothetical protein